MKLRSGKTTQPTGKNGICTHDKCKLWMKTVNCCCYCADKRPIKTLYVAFNKSYLSDASLVDRTYHYCPACKVVAKPKQKVSEPLPQIKVVAKQQPINTELVEANLIISNLKKEIDQLKRENESLKKENTALTKEVDEKEQEECEIALYESGMGDLVYHLGFCSDVIGDCWIEHYHNGGVAGLKKALREVSKYVHKKNMCAECSHLIDGIHD